MEKNSREKMIEAARTWLNQKREYSCDPACSNPDPEDMQIAENYGIEHDSTTCCCECHDHTGWMVDFALEQITARDAEWVAAADEVLGEGAKAANDRGYHITDSDKRGLLKGFLRGHNAALSAVKEAMGI